MTMVRAQRGGPGAANLKAALLALAALLSCGAGPVGRPDRDDERAWRGVASALEQGEAQRVLDRAEDYLAAFPEGANRLDAMRVAGEAAMELEMWTACRRHGDGYLAGGGRTEAEVVAWRVAICLSREGRSKDAVPALRNAASHDSDPERSATAARELVALLLFDGEWRSAVQAQGLLVEMGLFDQSVDLPQSRKAAESISDEALALMEEEEPPAVAGLLAFLLLERKGSLAEGRETEPARRRFADRYPEHPLIALVPGAAAWAAEPEDTNPRVIGVLLPISGRYQEPGQLALRGIELAVDQIRADESLGLQDLVLVPIDTAGDPEAALEGLRRLAKVEKAIAVLGPIVATEAELVAAEADEIGIPVLMMTQHSGLGAGRRGVFNTWVGLDEQVDALVGHAMGRMEIQSFAIAYPDRENGGAMAARFWSGVEEQGGRVSAAEPYGTGVTDFRETARRLLGRHYMKSSPSEADGILPWLGDRVRPQVTHPQIELEPGLDFQAVFLPDSYKAAAMAAPGFLYEQINVGGSLSESRGLPVVLLGGAAFNHPDLVQRGGRYSEGIVFVDGFFGGSMDPAVQRFVLTYRERHAAEPMALEATAYDATRFLCQLLSAGARTRRDLRGRLAISVPGDSVIGSTGFGSDGEMRHSMLVLQVRKGELVQVFPEPPALPIHLELTQEGKILRYQEGPEGQRVLVDEHGDPLAPPAPAEGGSAEGPEQVAP